MVHATVSAVFLWILVSEAATRSFKVRPKEIPDTTRTTSFSSDSEADYLLQQQQKLVSTTRCVRYCKPSVGPLHNDQDDETKQGVGSSACTYVRASHRLFMLRVCLLRTFRRHN